MKQNVFTIYRKVDKVTASVTLDLSEEISDITNKGWVIKQVFQNALTLNGNPYITVTLLTEKPE